MRNLRTRNVVSRFCDEKKSLATHLSVAPGVNYIDRDSIARLQKLVTCCTVWPLRS
jgi:hypothetical protein